MTFVNEEARIGLSIPFLHSLGHFQSQITCGPKVKRKKGEKKGLLAYTHLTLLVNNVSLALLPISSLGGAQP